MCSLKEKLSNLDGIEYKCNCDLKTLSTWGTGGIAEIVFFPKTKMDIVSIKAKFPEAIIIGNGSNILFSKNRIVRPIIVTKKMDKKIVFNDCTVSVSAGVGISQLCVECAKRGLGGLENLFGIPGTVGGALIMNAGAFGTEICDCLQSVEVFCKGRVKLLTKEDIKFSHRYSSLEKEGVILEACFKLKKEKEKTLEEKIKQNILWRQEHQPAGKSAGSVFKRAIEPAGLLIDKCGLKGIRVGGAVVSHRHANFIINDNNASADDILALIKLIKDEVYKTFGVLLEEEIVIVGEEYDSNGRLSHTF